MMDHIPLWWDWRAAALAACICPFLISYLLTTIYSFIIVSSKNEDKPPAIDPSADFVFGNLFAFAFGTRRYLAYLINRFGPHVPVRIRVGTQSYFFVSGPEYVLRLFRSSRELTTVPASTVILQRVFGTPPEATTVLLNDDTGTSAQPLPGSHSLPADQRYHQIIHQGMHDNLSGLRLAELASRFLANLDTELDNLDMENKEWLEIPDLYSFIQNSIFNASTLALCGPHIFEIIPTLTEDFWNFDSQIGGPLKGVPRFINPGAYKIRDKLVKGIVEWHRSAEAHIDRNDEELEKKSWEPYYGARLVRDRARDLSKVIGLGDEARAANDLGLIWGTNSNIVPTLAWSIIDTICRPALLSQVHAELASIKKLHPTGNFEQQMPDLLSNLLLQSIYCEELRLRNSSTIQRSPISSNFKIGPWKFPKNDIILMSIWFAGRDKTVWNEGANGEHDVESFWPERFIVYPNDPHSGPRKPDSTKHHNHNTEKITEPKLVTDTVNGSWIPYGGGQKICPGRFFAKQEAIGGMAIFLSKFDIELIGNQIPEPDLSYFALGVLPPKGKYPARLRRRSGKSGE
ncbi:hypothetical protein SBOR_0457 [Sclerotinia borealis F-4128]|uniref:Cytochrome P450 n=1 Tax=Sclerotinia borealis (strain F-4128) TaxID=1432307 RepID=W9CSR2_SCLBF|nr:hypothetical protein SBOR_0457 [Sclerotinia borealis F-4128]